MALATRAENLVFVFMIITGLTQAFLSYLIHNTEVQRWHRPRDVENGLVDGLTGEELAQIARLKAVRSICSISGLTFTAAAHYWVHQTLFALRIDQEGEIIKAPYVPKGMGGPGMHRNLSAGSNNHFFQCLVCSVWFN